MQPYLRLLLLVIIQKVVGLRMTNADEMQGMDFSIHGEHGYGMVNAGLMKLVYLSKNYIK